MSATTEVAKVVEISFISCVGAFGLGALIGWYTYYVNRYRKGDVALGDLTTIVGVIGGGAITALFDPKGPLFGFYGLGLFAGFFGYFAVLVWLVRHSNGAYTTNWFLDGRRKTLPVDEEIPDGTAPTVRPFSVNPQSALARSATAEETPLPVSRLLELIEQQELARRGAETADVTLGAEIAQTTDATKRAALAAKQKEVQDGLRTLRAQQLRDIFASPEVENALNELRQANADLTTEANRLRDAADKIAAAAKVIGYLEKVIGFIVKLVA